MTVTPLVERRVEVARTRTPTRGSRRDLGWLAAIVVLGLGLRLLYLDYQSIWLDEAMSYVYSSHTLGEIWAWARPLDPYYPPGYFTLLRGWTELFGTSEAALRGLSVLAGVATIPLVYLAGRLVDSGRTGLLAAALMAVAGYQIEYAQEARSYTLLALAATAVLWAVAWLSRYPRLATARMRGNPARWVWVTYVLGVLAALLLHNTGFLVWGSAGLAGVLAWSVHLRKRTPSWGWRFMQANVVVLLLYLVSWMPVFIRQSLTTAATEGVSRATPTLEAVWYALRHLAFVQLDRNPSLLSAPEPLGLAADLLVLTLIAAGLVLVARRAHRLVLASFLLAGIAVSLLVSVTFGPIFVANTLLWTSVPIALLVAIPLARLTRRVPLLLAPVVVLVLLSGVTTMEYFASVAKEPWREVAATVASEARPGDVIVHSADYVRHPLNYYLDHYRLEGVTAVSIDYDPTIENVRLAIPDAERIWLVYAHEHFADPNGFTPQVIAERATEVDEYFRWSPDVRLILYESTPQVSIDRDAATLPGFDFPSGARP